jgi:hypothetical protein
MRLTRVLHLYNSGNWYDGLISRSNAPYGVASHWTRPLDVLLIAGAWVAKPFFTSFRSALFWWGVMISPVLYLLALISLDWATKSVVSSPGRNYLGLIFLAQPMIFAYCEAGRPDHHSLLLLCFILSLGFFFRLLQPGFRVWQCYAAGAISAFSMWISVESLTVVFLYGVILALLWLCKDQDFYKKNLHFWIALTLGTAGALIIEHPPHDFIHRVYDSLSIVHVGIFAIITFCWLICASLHYSSNAIARFNSRLIIFLTGLMLIAGMIYLLFPKFFSGPFVDVDSRVKMIWLSKVQEIQPLLPPRKDWLPELVWFIGSALFALPATLYFFWQERYEEYQRWLVVLLGLLLFLLLAVYQKRWATYTETLLIIPLTELLSYILKRQEHFSIKAWRLAARFFTVSSFCVMPFFLAVILGYVSTGKYIAQKDTPVPLSTLCQYLNEAPAWHDHPMRILSYVDFGPEILYRTRDEVIATPYHRNDSGIWISHKILYASRNSEAHRLIKARGINLILLSPWRKGLNQSSKQKSTFEKRLLQGKVPGWLRSVSLPSKLSPWFKLFEVTG